MAYPMNKVDKDSIHAKIIQRDLSSVLKVLAATTKSLKALEGGTSENREEDVRNVALLIETCLELANSDSAEHFYD